MAKNKEPSFSSSLLDSIYRSIDENGGAPNEQKMEDNFLLHRRNNAAAKVEEEIESLRKAIMIEKWMENYKPITTTTTTTMHFPSNSGSSTDSSIFSSSETDSSVSRSYKIPQLENKPATKKSRAQKIYGDLKKVREPVSPGGRIASFLNSIFSPRKTNELSSMRKSKSMKDTTTTTTTTTTTATKTCSLESRSCLSKNRSSGDSKSKRSVRFCIVDEDCRPCGNKSVLYYDEKEDLVNTTVVNIGSYFIKKNTKSVRKNQEVRDLDELSCGSSDLFELENIGRYEEELPVYETTNLELC
ncbi:hypothetical protein ACP275_12G129200 [Erythranthe tilingii]